MEEIEDWLKFFSQNEEAKKILKKENSEIYTMCEEMEKEKAKHIVDVNRSNDSLQECMCDYDIDCAYCSAVCENEKRLVEKFELNAEDDEAELKEYRYMKNKVRREKYHDKNEKEKVPIPALPERELCEYQKIRENNMAQLNRELAEHEARWEAKSKKNKEAN